MQSLIRALNGQTRVEILKILMKDDDCVCHLAAKLKKDVSTISRHVELLKMANLIETRREGKMLMCKIRDREALGELFNAIRRLGGKI